MRSRIWLVLWIIGILFPLAFLGKLWPAFGSAFNAIFSPSWMHVIMHIFLYTVLGILLTHWFKSLSIQSALIVLGLALLVGCFHEGLQILTARQWPGWSAEIFDLSVDLAGAAIGLALARFWARRKEQSPSRLPKRFSGPQR